MGVAGQSSDAAPLLSCASIVCSIQLKSQGGRHPEVCVSVLAVLLPSMQHHKGCWRHLSTYQIGHGENLWRITHLLQSVQQCCCFQSALMLHARGICVSISINVQQILSIFRAASRALSRRGIAHCKDAAPIFLCGLHQTVATSPW